MPTQKDAWFDVLLEYLLYASMRDTVASLDDSRQEGSFTQVLVNTLEFYQSAPIPNLVCLLSDKVQALDVRYAAAWALMRLRGYGDSKLDKQLFAIAANVKEPTVLRLKCLDTLSEQWVGHLSDKKAICHLLGDTELRFALAL